MESPPTAKRSDADRRVRQTERLARFLRLLQLIPDRGRWDADGLAEELECHRRTIYRSSPRRLACDELQSLSIADVPWYFDEPARAYRVRPGFMFPIPGPAEQTDSVFHHQLRNSKPLTEKMVQDGDAFVGTLQEFLSVLRSN